MEISHLTLLANLRYRLVAEMGGYTIEQLDQVNICLLKYLTDLADDPIAIQQARISHTPLMQALAMLGRAEVLEAEVLGLPSWVGLD